MIKKIGEIDRIETLYRKKVLYPHRKKHEYPKHVNDCQLCTPLVRDVFDFIRQHHNPKVKK